MPNYQGNIGWICPKCGRSINPNKDHCPFCSSSIDPRPTPDPNPTPSPTPDPNPAPRPTPDPTVPIDPTDWVEPDDHQPYTICASIREPWTSKDTDITAKIQKVKQYIKPFSDKDRSDR